MPLDPLTPLPPPPVTDPEAELRRTLARHRAIATGLLGGMAAVAVGSLFLPPGFPARLLHAAATAGVVGGLADWFAVTALFRHPLGLPIPHTAIIPHQKERLGQGLGRFVANHVFTEAEVRRVLGRLDVAGILGAFMADPAATAPAARALAGTLPRILGSLEDGRARRLLGRLLPRLAGGPAGARVLASTLRTLVAGNRHQEVFGLTLGLLKDLLAAKEPALKAAIEAGVRREGGWVLGYGAKLVGVADRVVRQINKELAELDTDDAALRLEFDAWLRREIDRLETDPERAAAVGRALRAAVSHPAVAAWLGDIWSRLRAALEADAQNPRGRTVALLEGAFANAGEMLARDEAARERLNQTAQAMLLPLLPAAQARLAEFIAGVVRGWDTAQVTEKIELRVGRDLQYVRMNGTLVGALVGGLIYALSALLGYPG